MTKYLFILVIAEVVALSFVFSPHPTNLRLITCDVGQGDAHLILYENVQILVDAGERQDVLTCLGKYMPLSDHHLEVAIMTHPEFDHAGGFNSVLERYSVGMLVANSIDNSTESYRLLKKKVGDQHIPVIQPAVGDELVIQDLKLTFLYPGPDLVTKTGITQLGAESAKQNLNDYSIVFLLTHGESRALYTGDLSPEAVPVLLSQGIIGHVTMLKVPHHGSKNGLTEQLLSSVTPDISIISVGRKNKFGHPDREILDLLSTSTTKVYRTDLVGDVALVEENGKLVFGHDVYKCSFSTWKWCFSQLAVQF